MMIEITWVAVNKGFITRATILADTVNPSSHSLIVTASKRLCPSKQIVSRRRLELRRTVHKEDEQHAGH